jgi:hypothetical protein
MEMVKNMDKCFFVAILSDRCLHEIKNELAKCLEYVQYISERLKSHDVERLWCGNAPQKNGITICIKKVDLCAFN